MSKDMYPATHMEGPEYNGSEFDGAEQDVQCMGTIFLQLLTGRADMHHR
jgi:hypothetical protein